MASSHDTVERLAVLDQILARVATVAPAGADATTVLLNGIPAERIRALMADLTANPDRELDAVDALVMRTLFNEYVNGVAHARGLAAAAAAAIDGSVRPIRQARRAIHRCRKALGLKPAPDRRVQK